VSEFSQEFSASFFREEFILDMVALQAAHLGGVQSLPNFIHTKLPHNWEVLSAHLLSEIIKLF
jgi:hypothetical protein